MYMWCKSLQEMRWPVCIVPLTEEILGLKLVRNQPTSILSVALNVKESTIWQWVLTQAIKTV